jgi:heat shock protein HslJ
VKEKLPENDRYPITLTFRSDTTFYGRHDANSYDGKYKLEKDNISLTDISGTDCGDIEWYLSYIVKLHSMSKITLTDTTLKFSNKSLIFNYISKEKFERDYFKLEEWYNY